MEGLINSIGGYESWQFAFLMAGCLSLGLVIYFIWKYTVFIPLFGILLFYFYLNHPPQPMVARVGIILATIVLILMLVSAWGISKRTKSNPSENEEGKE